MSDKLIPKSARARARSEVLRAWARALKPSGMTLLFVALLPILFTPPAYAELENFQAADVVVGQPNFTTAKEIIKYIFDNRIR